MRDAVTSGSGQHLTAFFLLSVTFGFIVFLRMWPKHSSGCDYMQMYSKSGF